jgi:hypothetical protein
MSSPQDIFKTLYIPLEFFTRTHDGIELRHLSNNIVPYVIFDSNISYMNPTDHSKVID